LEPNTCKEASPAFTPDHERRNHGSPGFSECGSANSSSPDPRYEDPFEAASRLGNGGGEAESSSESRCTIRGTSLRPTEEGPAEVSVDRDAPTLEYRINMLERQTGLDIDGDGDVGLSGRPARAEEHLQHPQHPQFENRQAVRSPAAAPDQSRLGSSSEDANAPVAQAAQRRP
jgi:hypothetical protein